jgi:Mg2+-importing ATPase
MLADGVNDTAALHGADIGIGAAGAVGVARTAADAVLLTDRLPALAEAVTLARQATLNATKYLKATLVANLGNTLSVLAAGLLLPFLPLLPVQLVAQNLCYDLAQLALPYDRTDPDQLSRPHRWNIPDLIRFTCCLAPIGTATDLATFALLAGPFHALTHPAEFRAGWLLENLLTQILAVHVLRTDRLPTPRRRASRAVLATTLVALAATLTLLASPLATVLGLRPPPAALLALTAGLLVPLYLAALSAAKAAYRRAPGHWL